MKILLTLFLLIFACQVSFGQEYQYDEDNWLSEMGYPMPFLRQSYPNKIYTKEDVTKAKEKLSLINNSTSKDEWEGYYQRWGDLNQYGLIWKSNSGFIHYNIYTCNVELRGLWLGNITNLSESVTLNYEKSIYYFYSKKRGGKTQETFIKIKIGERHFLVPKSRLKDFCEYAVGLQNYYDDDIEKAFWWKVEDSKKESSRLPVLPLRYKHFLRYPIEAKIISLGQRKITYITPEGKKEPHTAQYSIKINKGKVNGVTNQMEFYVPELKERAYIRKVFKSSSIAVIERELDETSLEKCKDDNYQEQPCQKITVGLYAITKNRF